VLALLITAPPLPICSFLHLQDFHNAPMQMGMPSLLNAHLEPFWPAPGVYARGVHTRETAAAQEKQALGNSQ
jgi:hypothetical protein